jgi:hypothetical protein
MRLLNNTKREYKEYGLPATLPDMTKRAEAAYSAQKGKSYHISPSIQTTHSYSLSKDAGGKIYFIKEICVSFWYYE